MPPNKKHSFPYQDQFDIKFGLQVTARNEHSGLVEACVCRFCECWGRESDNDGDDEVGDNTSSGRKRKQTCNNKHWKHSFRSDNIRKHMLEQHPKKFKEYQVQQAKVDSTPELMKKFFEQLTVDAFFKKRSTIIGRRASSPWILLSSRSS